ncbi:hypothetical protein Bbelb_318750 [Branchiostoma belcheri]|nr:hypothetical protein Bbelb_318750 [Branchiostoma belcheri]
MQGSDITEAFGKLRALLCHPKPPHLRKWTQLDTLKQATSTIETLQKILKKIHGDGQDTMQYVTSVLNEWGQFHTTVLVASEYEGCYRRLAQGLIQQAEKFQTRQRRLWSRNDSIHLSKDTGLPHLLVQKICMCSICKACPTVQAADNTNTPVATDYRRMNPAVRACSKYIEEHNTARRYTWS